QVRISDYCDSQGTASFFLSKRLNHCCSSVQGPGEMTPPTVLIAGIGKIFLGDDAFGCEVLTELNRRQWPENIRMIDFGIRGFDLAYALLYGFDLVVLVAATLGVVH